MPTCEVIAFKFCGLNMFLLVKYVNLKGKKVGRQPARMLTVHAPDQWV